MKITKDEEEVKVKAKVKVEMGIKTFWRLLFSLADNAFSVDCFKGKMMYKDFTEMPVWQKAMKVVEEVYHLTFSLPRSEDFALSSQSKRASLSIPSNIAEAFGRSHVKDKINFYFYARGSAFELRSHLYAGQKLNFYREQDILPVDNLCLEITESINKIIKGLKNNN